MLANERSEPSVLAQLWTRPKRVARQQHSHLHREAPQKRPACILRVARTYRLHQVGDERVEAGMKKRKNPSLKEMKKMKIKMRKLNLKKIV